MYPGSPEPLGWGEQRGEHCAAVVEIEKGGVPTGGVDRYSREAVRNPAAWIAPAVRRVPRSMPGSRRSSHTPDPQNVFLRLSLVGDVGPDCAVDNGRIRSRYQTTYADVLIDGPKPPSASTSRPVLHERDSTACPFKRFSRSSPPPKPRRRRACSSSRCRRVSTR